jgi:lipoic acid synthetase
MVGFGETQTEIFRLMDDLKAARVDVVTIGQYLRPSMKHVPVIHYLKEEAYGPLIEYGLNLGFRHVFAGPFVRSSYNAAEALAKANEAKA